MFARRLLGVLTVVGLLTPGVGWAQSATTGAIAGSARDTTGAVLPGVTVEAASPALIEKVRTAVTDGQGNYRIVDLRPGTYSVTFTLAGFGTYRRDGIELTTGFTATANGELKVGSVEETITVTAASPIVDVQNTRQQTVLSRQVLDSVPTNQTLQAYAALTLGAKLTAAGAQDVGGNQGETEGAFGVHGGRGTDQMYTMDGMRFLGADSAASSRHFMVNQVFVQEVTLETKGISAESETGGVQINVVPKEGSNEFRGNLAVNGTGSALQGENLTDELRQRGLTGTPSVKKIWDFGGGFGGPIKADKLWFYTAHRFWGTQNYAPANYYNKNAGKYVGRSDSGVTLYEADLSRPAYIDIYNEDHSVRFTWQASAKDKFAFSNSTQRNCNCNWNVDRLNLAPEASLRHLYSPVNLFLASWNRPVTNRLLLEAGVMNLYDIWNPSRNEAVARNDRAILELSTGYLYNYQIFGSVVDNGRVSKPQTNGRFSVSYITGSHGFKTGITYMHSAVKSKQELNDPPLSYQFFNGSPVQLQQWASPLAVTSILNPVMALYAQDQWTLGRMTLNLGLRYDYFRGSSGAQSLPAGPFVPAREFAARNDIPNWKDISPRLGVAYDLSGNGATALKLSVGRGVVAGVSGAATDPNNPANLVARSATRTWNDVNRDYWPDCNLLDPTVNGECGASSTSRLGQPVIINRWADDVLKGFGNRIYNWQISTTVQHEIRPGFGVNAGYYRMWYGNFSITDNLAVTPANYDPYCATAPTDPRLGQVSGQGICDLFDLNPSKLGQIDNVVTQISNYGTRTEVYNGFEVGTRVRFGTGGLVQGGVSSGQTVEDNCTVIDSPQTLGWQSTANTPMRPSFCKVTMPFKGQTQVKVAVSYPLPWGFSVAGAFQNLPGVPIAANLSVTSAQVAGSLGRNLSLGTATVPLIEPNTMFEDRLSQLDLRFTRNFRVGGGQLKGMFDVYNVLNNSTVLGVNAAYGGAWLRPLTILAPRLFKFGAQFDF